MIYFENEKEVKQVSYVIISDCLEHNTIAVYMFQKKFLNFLKTKFKNLPKKIYYFSDGSAAQYKNKENFCNLHYHKDHFNIEAEWHFPATEHGKGPCDEVGDSAKRWAACANLQRSNSHTLSTL